MADLCGRGFGENQQRSEHYDNQHRPGNPQGSRPQKHQRFSDAIAHDAARLGQSGHRGLPHDRAPQREVTDSGNRHHPEHHTHTNPGVVTGPRGVSKQPGGKHQQNDRQGKRQTSNKPRHGVQRHGGGPGHPVVKPFNDDSGNRQNKQDEWNSVFAVVRVDRFSGKQPKHRTGGVRHRAESPRRTRFERCRHGDSGDRLISRDSLRLRQILVRLFWGP